MSEKIGEQMSDKIERLERCTPDPRAAGRMIASTLGAFVRRDKAAAREKVLVEAFEEYISDSCSGLEETQRAGLDNARRVLAEIEETAL